MLSGKQTGPRRDSLEKLILSAEGARRKPNLSGKRTEVDSARAGSLYWSVTGDGCTLFVLSEPPFVIAPSAGNETISSARQGCRALQVCFARIYNCRAGAAVSRCRNCQICTNLFVCSVRRFAVGGGMPPPYRGFSSIAIRYSLFTVHDSLLVIT